MLGAGVYEMYVCTFVCVLLLCVSVIVYCPPVFLYMHRYCPHLAHDRWVGLHPDFLRPQLALNASVNLTHPPTSAALYLHVMSTLVPIIPLC